jgi:hypothetical protein
MFRTTTAFDADSKSTIVTTTDLALCHVLSALARAEAYALHGIFEKVRERVS